jgi:hypothetical protein
MVEYLAEVRRMEKFFDGFKVRYVARLDNRNTDHLAWIASSRAPIPSDVIIKKLTKPSIKMVETLREIDLMTRLILQATELHHIIRYVRSKWGCCQQYGEKSKG